MTRRVLAHLAGGFAGGLVVGAVVVAAAIWNDKHPDKFDVFGDNQ